MYKQMQVSFRGLCQFAINLCFDVFSYSVRDRYSVFDNDSSLLRSFLPLRTDIKREKDIYVVFRRINKKEAHLKQV